MKRSQTILREKLRKSWRPFNLAPLSVAVAGLVLAGCGEEAQPQISAEVFKNLSDCINQNPELAAECQSAYQNALAEAAKTAPKYNSAADCNAEFGAGQCIQSPGTNWFMPMMAGYMFGKMMNSGRPSYSNVPVFTPKNPNNRNYGSWTTADGYSYGKAGSNSRVVLDNNALKSKPATTRTISRGGFGSTVEAKSNWGSKESSRSYSSGKSSSSSRSWGG
ncbi:MAG: DUF1190 family protein [Plesiomonas sp.]|uniref:DUF1190 family protein n=1 Tax=Plesiomonas sp. TaxID=2486279 RepID=UPI003EE76616